MNKQEQEIMDKFINMHKGINGFDVEYFEINGVKFTSEQFNRRARELGWINGYKWGVEYETNGKKPDLDDDVLVEWYAANLGGWMARAKLSNLRFNNPSHVEIQKFRIVDERYKPVEAGQAQGDNSLKVGEKVSFPSGAGVVLISDEDKNGVIIVKDDSGEYRRVARAVIERKADEEKRKFVEMGVEAVGDYFNLGDALRKLYDAGCRFIENKAAS